MRQHRSRVVILVWLLTGLVAGPGWAIDPLVQQAQQKLSRLGYDPGVADGLHGPHTRQALEAFQRAHQLPVTGRLDAATLQALDQATSPIPEGEPEARSPQDAVLHTVLHYLRYYADQPGRVLPYVTDHFRRGMAPQEWLHQTQQTLAARGYTYLAWEVQHLDVTDTQATVEVHTRVRMQGQEIMRQEVFTLRHAAEDDWVIDTWRVEVPPTTNATSRAGSQG